MMKMIAQRVMTVVVAVVALAGCMKRETDLYDPQRIVNENAAKVLGNIDPLHDWNSSTSGTVTVTADASLHTVKKVQILTESPFFKDAATVVGEAEVEKGQTVSVSYDAPNVYRRLIAACVDADGHYVVRAFDVGATHVSFASNTVTRSARRAATTYPEASRLKLELANSTPSYNAMRTQLADMAAASADNAFRQWSKDKSLSLWQGSRWQQERLWIATNGATGTEWTVENGTVLRTAEPLSPDEQQQLETIFTENLSRVDPTNTWGRKDNIDHIRQSNAVNFYNNHLTSDGTTPITVAPVLAASSEASKCHIYYYYYNPADIPAGTSEADYIRQLPKFKAIQCWHTMSKAGIPSSGSESFFRVHEYLLPYWGEPSALAPQQVSTADDYVTDGRLYRLRNGRQLDGAYYYMTFLPMNQTDKLATRYADQAPNVADQLWQLFTDTEGKTALYNVGAQQFLVWDGNWDTRYSREQTIVSANRYRLDDDHHIWRHNDTGKGLGTNLGLKDSKGVYTDKNTSIGENLQWFLEPYEGTGSQAYSAVTMERHPTATTAQSTVIPKGYRIGFMLRKLKGGQSWTNDDIVTSAYNGCCYGYGELNREINNLPGHFGSSKSRFTMQDDDPRAAYFAINGKTYICFEDGSDAQFSDFIIEVGGYDPNVLTEAPAGTEEKSTGVETDYLYDEQEVAGASYTLCFEDRSQQADYDLNDVVMRCKRVNTSERYRNWVELSLVAAGGTDDLILHIGRKAQLGSNGFDGMEVHRLFLVDDLQGTDRIVNTIGGRDIRQPLTYYYELDEGMTIPQFLATITIENVTTGETIGVAQTGEAPLGIITPFDFNYPMERESIVNAYTGFRSWTAQRTQHRDWYLYETDQKTYPAINVIRRIISAL